MMWKERISGNGKIVSETRSANLPTNKIKLAGSYEVEISQGSPSSVKVETDENLLAHLITGNEDGWLVIRPEDHVRLSPTSKIRIHITTDKLEAVSLAGSGNIMSDGKFTGSDKLSLNVSGSGSMHMEVNTPKVDVEVAGSGNITVSGETKNQYISIAGHGDYRAEDLKSEDAEVHIAGSGNVKLSASSHLDIHIAGSGNVYYKGSPAVTQHIAGSGVIQQIH